MGSKTAAPSRLTSVVVSDQSQATNAVLIPVKAFRDAKARLSAALAADKRAELARAMATHIVQAQTELAVYIACDDDGVAEWATSVGAEPIWCPGTDLNGAVQHGFAHLGSIGIGWVAIAHSDLPFASSLAPLLGWQGVTIVPDRHRTGSNVMALPTSIPFTFAYGEGSFARHAREAVRHRRGLRIVHDSNLGWDIDHPSDLDTPTDKAAPALLHTRPARQ